MNAREALAAADEANQRYPMYLLTDHDYALLGAVAVEDGRWVGRDTAGRVLFDRQDHEGALRAGKSAAPRVVCSAWYGVEHGKWPGYEARCAEIQAAFETART